MQEQRHREPQPDLEHDRGEGEAERELEHAGEQRLLDRALRSDLIDPTISVYNGRVVKRTGDGAIVEFRSVVEAVRCAIEIQNSMIERNAGLPPERRTDFRMAASALAQFTDAVSSGATSRSGWRNPAKPGRPTRIRCLRGR